MLRLRPYKPCDAQVIIKWLKNEYAFRQWSADRYDHFPISPEDMNAYYDRDRNNDAIWGMTAFDDSGVVGHLTMRYPKDGRKDGNPEGGEEIRFGFVIIDDTKRGRGYGKEMLSLAIRYAFDILKVEKISLGVFENNRPAILCYTSCGFQLVPLKKPEQYQCLGETWNCLEMVLHRKAPDR